MSRRFRPPTESDIPLHGWRPYSDVHRERIRAHDKHDGNGDSMERRDFDDGAWLSVLVEEVGEVAKALCDHRHHGVYGDRQALALELRAELVQVAAMTVAWIDAIDLEIEGGGTEAPCVPGSPSDASKVTTVAAPALTNPTTTTEQEDR